MTLPPDASESPEPDVGVPSRVQSRAAGERLGGLRSVRDARPSSRRFPSRLVVLGLPGFVVLPFTVGFLLSGLGWASGLGLVLSVGYLGAAGRLLLRDVRPGYGRVLYVYEHGLVLVTRRDVTALPWDAVTELRVWGVRGAGSRVIIWHCRLIREDGREIALGSEFPEAQEIVRLLSVEVTERLLPKYIARVESGGTVRLGPFEITRDALTKDAETLPLGHIAEVEIDDGMVRVSRSDRLPGMTAIAGQVPNVIAFTSLVDHLRRTRPPGPRSP